MRILVKIFIVIAIFIAAHPLFAQEGRKMLSLDEAFTITFVNNPSIKASQYEEKSAVQQRRAAIGLRMPQINIVGAYTYMEKDLSFDVNNMKAPVGSFVEGVIGSGIIPPASIPPLQQLMAPIMGADWSLKLQDQSLGFVGGEITIPIFLGGKINTANRVAKINESSVVFKSSQTKNALVSELVQRYYGLALAIEVVKVRQEVVRGVSKHLYDAIALEKNGIIPYSERLYVEFKMSEAERELQNAELQLQTISDALNNTLSFGVDYTPITSMFIMENIENVEYFQELAIVKNPLLNQVSLKRKLAEEGVKLKRSEFMPQVVAMGGGSIYNYQVSNIVPRWAVGVGVSFKIFDGLSREYGYSAAKQSVNRVALLQSKASDEVTILVEKLYNQMKNYGNQITSIEASIKFAEEYLRAKSAAFLEGLSSSTDVVDAELNLAKVRTERMQAAYNYDVLLAQLLEAAGISSEYLLYLRRADAKHITFDK